MEKKVLIIEGPAGSGKSRLIGTLPDTIFRVSRIHRDVPRDYGNSAAMLSMYKDHAALLQVLSTQYQYYVIDRCLYSQYVYESIRQDRVPDAQNYARRAELWVENLCAEYSTRSFSHVQKLRVIPVFLMPTLSQLLYFRSLSSKYYPFDPEKEIELYERLVHATNGLRFIPNGDINAILRLLS